MEAMTVKDVAMGEELTISCRVALTPGCQCQLVLTSVRHPN